MNNSQVAHIWAQGENKSARGSNFFCENNTIYSYGYHFPIAKILPTGEILFTVRRRSITTAKHIGYVRQAIADMSRVYYVDRVEVHEKSGHVINLRRMADDIELLKSQLADAKRDKKRLELLGSIKRHIAEHNRYSIAFKLRKRLKPIDESKFAALIEAAKLQQETNKRAESKRQAKQLAEQQEILAAWRQGGEKFPSAKLVGIHFRVVGTDLQSTMGAEFPIEHARRAWRQIARIYTAGADWIKEQCGEAEDNRIIRLGHFQVDRIETDGTIVAGCHRITKQAVLDAAQLIGAQ
jgi:hypothetical protein